MVVPENNKKIAKFIAGAMGFEPHVIEYKDKNETHAIHILNLIDPIDRDVKIYCSIGLSNYDNIVEMKNGNKNIPIELLMTANAKYDNVPNILSTCCFYIIKDNYNCQPGTVYKHMVEMYYKNNTMKHILFIEPYLWEDKISDYKIDNKVIHFLMGIPISDKELEYKLKNGTDNLLEKIIEVEDIYNYNRKSII
jgi:hypothetical protein